VDAEKFKSNRRDRILFLLIAHLLQQPSLDAAAAAELFATLRRRTQSVKYGTAINIDIEKTRFRCLSMSMDSQATDGEDRFRASI